MFECWLFSMRELSMGNETMRGVADTALEALTAMGPPNKEAEKLMKVYRG
jgi:hypothetical protein